MSTFQSISEYFEGAAIVIGFVLKTMFCGAFAALVYVVFRDFWKAIRRFFS